MKDGLATGLRSAACGYVGTSPLGEDVPWLQLIGPGHEPDSSAAALIYVQGAKFEPVDIASSTAQLRGMAVHNVSVLEDVIVYGLDSGFDFLLLCGSGNPLEQWPELASPPDLSLLREAIVVLRKLKKEEAIDLVWYGGARSGTDAAKLIAMGCKAVVFSIPLALAVGGSITHGGVEFASDYSIEERGEAVANLLKAHASEASMMARCTGKTQLHNLEPEDLRSITIATATATGIPMPGTQAA